MRTLIATALVASAGFATLAQAQTTPPANNTSSVRIKGIPSARHQITDDQFQDIRGDYRLSNGRQLTLSSYNQHYYAQIDGLREQEIVPTADKQFVATNGDMQLDFDEFRGDHTVDVVVRTGMRSNNVVVMASR